MKSPIVFRIFFVSLILVGFFVFLTRKMGEGADQLARDEIATITEASCLADALFIDAPFLDAGVRMELGHETGVPATMVFASVACSNDSGVNTVCPCTSSFNYCETCVGGVCCIASGSTCQYAPAGACCDGSTCALAPSGTYTCQ